MKQTPAIDAVPARAPLTRARIVEGALQLIDEAGLEKLSMRRLGALFKVEAMALYHHFKSKGELLDAVLDRLIEDVEIPAPVSSPPMQRLRLIMTQFRQVALVHPRAFILIAARRYNTPAQFAHYDGVLAVFKELGLNPKQCAHWFRLIGGYVCGAGMAEVASRELIPEPTPLALEREPQTIAWPHVREVAPHLAVNRLGLAFEFSLDVLFDALASTVARSQSNEKAAKVRQAAAPRR